MTAKVTKEKKTLSKRDKNRYKKKKGGENFLQKDFKYRNKENPKINGMLNEENALIKR